MEKIQEGGAKRAKVTIKQKVGQIIRDNVFTYFNLIFLVLVVLLCSSEALNTLVSGRRAVNPRNCAGSPLDGSCVRCDFCI